jgi:protein arginine kinase activator
MQCQICNKRTATIHLTEISEGVRTEMHICEQCAADQGIAAQSQMSLNELLSNLLASQPGDDEIFGPSSDQESACPNCGFTLGKLRKEGMLGCPDDYEVFEAALLPLIERAHGGNTTHAGKMPSKTPQPTKRLVELANLRRQLEIAVKNEDYEEAAKLRDEIKKLE